MKKSLLFLLAIGLLSYGKKDFKGPAVEKYSKANLKRFEKFQRKFDNIEKKLQEKAKQDLLSLSKFRDLKLSKVQSESQEKKVNYNLTKAIKKYALPTALALAVLALGVIGLAMLPTAEGLVETDLDFQPKCESAGGKWQADTKTCTYKQPPRGEAVQEFKDSFNAWCERKRGIFYDAEEMSISMGAKSNVVSLKDEITTFVPAVWPYGSYMAEVGSRIIGVCNRARKGVRIVMSEANPSEEGATSLAIPDSEPMNSEPTKIKVCAMLDEKLERNPSQMCAEYDLNYL